MLSHVCNGPTGLHAGARYLVSASYIGDDGPSTNRIEAWQLDGNRATLVESMYLTEESKYLNGRIPSEPRAPSSLRDALALVAPGTQLPNTDASPERALNANLWLMFALLLVLVRW